MNKKPCSQPPGRKPGWPDGPDDVINKYGTYEVQATCGTENDFPMIAQGLPKQGGKPGRKLPRSEKSRETLQPEE
mgnify:FL=1